MSRLAHYAVGVAFASAVILAPGHATAQNYNWSGLYFGANVGWMGTNLDSFWSNSPPALTRNFSHDSDSGVAGLHIGLQQQFGQFVLGVEVGFGKSFDDGFQLGSPNTGCPAVTFNCSARLDTFVTVGPRLGWAGGNWLLYVTGGYANAAIESTAVSAAGVFFDRTSRRHDGWFLGGGVEFALTNNVILGLEYQHLEFDSAQHESPTTPGPLSVNARIFDADVDVVRARLTLKLGRSEPFGLLK